VDDEEGELMLDFRGHSTSSFTVAFRVDATARPETVFDGVAEHAGVLAVQL
jgi:hypothetical protein